MRLKRNAIDNRTLVQDYALARGAVRPMSDGHGIVRVVGND